MEDPLSSRSPLKGTVQRLVIYFSYGGQYLKKGDDIIWCAREDVHHALLMTKSDAELTYEVLVEKIISKLGPNEAKNEIKLSYFPVGVDPKRPVYIFNTIDFLCYLETCDGKKNGVLHVETKTNVPREYRSSHASNEDMISSIRVNCGVGNGSEPSEMFAMVAHEEECEDLDNTEDRDTFLYENDNVDVRDSRVVVVEDDLRNVEWEDGLNVIKGQEFECKQDVIERVEKASYVNCFNFDIVKSDTTRYVVKCSEFKNGCKWALRAAKIKDSNWFSIRTYTKFHTCSRVSSTSLVKRRKGTARMVANLVKENYPGKLDPPNPKTLMGMVQGKYGHKVSYSTSNRGRKLAIADVRGSPEESYKMLHSYLYMLQWKNPGTVSYVEVDNDQKFKYLFFALGACIEGFQVMRKVIIVDGTHLKNGYGGVLLVATAQDPNHHHYPIAFGVVDGEKDDSVAWFFKKLKTLIPDEPGLVFLSDRNQSLIKMIREVYPLSHHGYCVYHLSQNVKMHASNTNKDIVATKFREMAHAYTQVEFQQLYDDFKSRYPSAAVYLEKSVEPNKWARCFFPGERYNMDTTNCAESLNVVFREARQYALVPMIDAIVNKIAEWFNKHRQASFESHKLVPYVENVLHESCREALHLGVTVLNTYLLLFNVMDRDGVDYLVDLRTKTCACNHFDIDKYPCVHALAALLDAKKKAITDLEVHDLCSKFYWMDHWLLAYCRTIFPVPHMSQWKVPDDVRDMCVNPPDYMVGRGRQPTNRFPSVGENRQRRKNTGLYGFFTCST